MRADRLLALLLLLQARGRMNAAELAAELEVSERTIYRDIDALNAAGVPIYGEAGRNGGYALLEPYRTTLTGMTRAEIQALFMLSVPEPLTELGISRDLHSALRKLAAALPAAHHDDEAWIRQRFLLDSSWWRQDDDSVPHLNTVHQAIRQSRRLTIAYRPIALWRIVQQVDPYGLVAKAGAWYLVAGHDGQTEVYRIHTLQEARIEDVPAIRPADFELQTFWRAWCTEQNERRARFLTQLRIAPHFVAALPMYFGERIRSQIVAGTTDAQGHLIIELAFDSLEAARDRILTLGSGVEVLAPPELRLSVYDFATQTAAIYQKQISRETRVL